MEALQNLLLVEEIGGSFLANACQSLRHWAVVRVAQNARHLPTRVTPLETKTTIWRSLGSRTDMKSPRTNPSLTSVCRLCTGSESVSSTNRTRTLARFVIELALEVFSRVRPAVRKVILHPIRLDCIDDRAQFAGCVGFGNYRFDDLIGLLLTSPNVASHACRTVSPNNQPVLRLRDPLFGVSRSRNWQLSEDVFHHRDDGWLPEVEVVRKELE